MNKSLRDKQSDIIKGCTWNHSLWHNRMCNTSHCGIVVPQEKFHKKVFYFTPNVSCRWIKLEFINCKKEQKYDVLLGSVTSNWSVNVNFVLFCLLLRVNKCFLFSYIGSRSVWKPKNRSVWISVLCRHKFHLLQINSSKTTATAVTFCPDDKHTKTRINYNHLKLTT